MKIALINTLYSPFGVGGAGRSVRELAEGLVEAGHDVQVNTLAPAGFSLPEEDVNGVLVRRFRSHSAFAPFDRSTTQGGLGPLRKTAWHLAEATRRRARHFLDESFSSFRPDVVHSNNIAGFGLAAWAAAGQLPLIHTMRDYYLVCARSQLYRRGQLCERRCASCVALKAPVLRADRRPDQFIGVSQDIVERHRSLGAIRPDEHAGVIYNWPQIDSGPHLTDRSPSDGIRFGILGRVGEDKGTWRAIEGFSRLDGRLACRSRLLIAGSASNSDEERLRAVSRVDSRIQYLGAHVEPSVFFRQIDIALVPSQWHEPFGRVAAEARLAGVHVIASHVGGLPEALDEFGGGELIDSFQDPAAWASALSAASDRAYPRAFPHVGSSSVTAQYIDKYQQMTQVGR